MPDFFAGFGCSGAPVNDETSSISRVAGRLRIDAQSSIVFPFGPVVPFT
jgi:hypothetical protein